MNFKNLFQIFFLFKKKEPNKFILKEFILTSPNMYDYNIHLIKIKGN